MKYEKELKEVFEKVFAAKDLHLHEAIVAADVHGWDSLTHMNLLVQIENRFSIRFTLKDVIAFHKLGDIDNAIDRHLNRV